MKPPCQIFIFPVTSILFTLPIRAQTESWHIDLPPQYDVNTTSPLDIAALGCESATDGSGGIYQTGSTSGDLGAPNAGGLDAWIARFDADGTRLWTRQLGTTRDDFARAAAVDGSGGVYVAGWTEGGLAATNAGGKDPWIARYDATGQQLWIVQLGSEEDDQARTAATDGVGGLIVSGITRGDLAGPATGQEDVWAARFDASGMILWSVQLGTTKSEVVHASATDEAGGVFLAGAAMGSFAGPYAGGVWDAWLMRLDPSGAALWGAQETGGLPGRERLAYSVEPDGAGGVFVGGEDFGGDNFCVCESAWIARYDSSGTSLWQHVYGSRFEACREITCLVRDDHGGVYVGGNQNLCDIATPVPTDRDGWVARFDADGSLLWQRVIETTDQNQFVALSSDREGGAIATGWRTDGSGTQSTWISRFSTNLGEHYCTAVANSTGHGAQLDATGSSLVADDTFTLRASKLPPNTFGYFLTSLQPGDIFAPGSSSGRLCLSGAIGRYVGPGQVRHADPNGTFYLTLDLPCTPTPTGLVATLSGDVRYFQAWYRDAPPPNTSNFSEAFSVAFH